MQTRHEPEPVKAHVPVAAAAFTKPAGFQIACRQCQSDDVTLHVSDSTVTIACGNCHESVKM